jgi:hypothetical protein
VLGVDGSAGVGPTSTWSSCTSLPLQASILDKVVEALPSALVLVGCKWRCWDACRGGDRSPPLCAAAKSHPPLEQAPPRLPPPLRRRAATTTRLAHAMDALSHPAVVIDNGTRYAPPSLDLRVEA